MIESKQKPNTLDIVDFGLRDSVWAGDPDSGGPYVSQPMCETLQAPSPSRQA